MRLNKITIYARGIQMKYPCSGNDQALSQKSRSTRLTHFKQFTGRFHISSFEILAFIVQTEMYQILKF